MKNKFFLSLLLMLFLSISLFAQMDFETNNKKVYSDSMAKSEINSIYSKLFLGANFEELVLEYSQDPGSYMRGGVLGFTNMKNYDPIFVKNCTNLAIDAFSKPFKTDFGYHISRILLKKEDKVLIQHILIRVQE